MATFTPTLDRVLIDPTPVEEISEGGIILAQSETNKTPTQGTVVAIGPGRTENGVRVPMQTKLGDVVVWSKFAGSTIELGGRSYLIMRESDISGIVS
jgi:chaperonin GroES